MAVSVGGIVVFVAVAEAVGVAEGVAVKDGVEVGVADGGTPVEVTVGVGVCVGVCDGVGVRVGVFEGAGVPVKVGGRHWVGDGLSVTPGCKVAVAIEGVPVGALVTVGAAFWPDRIVGAKANAPKPKQ